MTAPANAPRDGDSTAVSPLDIDCSLCHVKMSTGTCSHLIDLGEGRVGMPRSVWEGLVEDRHRLRALEQEYGRSTSDG